MGTESVKTPIWTAPREPGLPWLFAIAAMPCAGGLLRQKLADKKGLDNNLWLGCLFWMCCTPCALCQETVQTGSLDDVVPPQLQKMERAAKDSDLAKKASSSTAMKKMKAASKELN